MTHPAGTAFVLRSDGIVGWTIRLLTRSRVNHAGICTGDGMTVEAQAAGAICRKEQAASQTVVYGNDLHARVETLAPGRSEYVAHEAEQLVGRRYNYLDLLALAWINIRHDPTDGPPPKPSRVERRVMRDDRLICSQLVDLAHTKAGVHLFTDGRLPGQVTPGDLAEVLANPSWPIHVDP